MAEVPLSPVVGEISPNIYKAAIAANLPIDQQKVIEQMSYTYKSAQKLLKMSEASSRKDFLKLDPTVQADINRLFPKEKRFQPEQGLLGKATQALTSGVSKTANLLFSPIIAGFKTAEVYGKTLNTVGTGIKQLSQDKPFSKQLLKDAFDGKNSWDWSRVATYEQKYGAAKVALARGLAEGRTPGESISLYGKGVDADMTEALIMMGDDPKKFNEMLQEIKQGAQFSPGRDKVESWVLADPNVDKNSWSYKLLKFAGIDMATPEGLLSAKKLVSGPIDTTYQLMIDPLSYVGIGPILKGATGAYGGVRASLPEAISRFGGMKSRGQKLADQFSFVSERQGLDAGMDWVFKQKDVVTLWDKQLGPVIKRYADEPTETGRGLIYREIRNDFPEWAELGVIKQLAKYKAFDAKGAKKFFTDNDDAGLLMTGRVDGVSYRRNGIPVARRSRVLSSALNRTAKSIFDPSPSTATTDEIIASGQKRLKTTTEILKKVADREEGLINPELSQLFELDADVSKAQEALQKIQTLGSRAPGRIVYGEDAIKTVEDVRNLANLAMPQENADAFAEAFLNESPEIQLTMIRNLYAGVMVKAGLHGNAGGEQLMDEILSATFNEKAGMFSTVRSEIDSELAGLLHKGGVRYENDVAYQSSRGIVEPSQVANSIAPLPFDDIYQVASGSKFAEKVNFINFVGGATRNNAVRKFTDFWTTHTLFPRLGTRSAVDESFFAYFAHPTYLLREFVFGGRGVRKATETITGSKTTQGMYKRGLYYPGKSGKIKGIPYRIPSMLPKLDPTKKISGAERREILESIAADLTIKMKREVTIGEVHHRMVIDSTVERAQEIYGDTLSEEAWNGLKRLMKYSPAFLDSMVNSVGAKSNLTGRIDSDYLDQAFVSTNLTADLKVLGLEQGSRYTELDVRKASKRAVSIAHFDNWSIRFPYNSEQVAEGVTLNPVNAFFRNGGLKTPSDFLRARDGILKDMGVARLPGGYEGEYIISNPEVTKAFNSLFSSTVYYRQQDYPEADIARIHVEAMLVDMRNTFHGGPKSFNQKLFDLVKSKREAMIGKSSEADVLVPNSWSKAAANITFKEFQDATIDHLPSVNIMTRLKNIGPEKDMQIFEEVSGWQGMYEKWQNWTMDVMDATVTGFYRQPAVEIFYNKNLKTFAPYEKKFEDRYYAQAKLDNPNIPDKVLRSRAKEHAEAQVTEMAIRDAMEKVLEYVDNPAIKTNLAVSVRSVGRFYRATEDFYRRVYRLYTKAPLQTIYRMRLLNQGLEASGDVYTDERGDQYIMFPTDTIINNAIEPVLRGLTGNPALQVPTFDNLTLKLRLINPSFSPDAGQPALAGPIASLSVLSIKGILRELPKILPDSVEKEVAPRATKFSEKFDSLALGQFGDRITFRTAIVPMFLDSIISTVSPAEMDRQKSTAVLQAISYHQAFGNALPTNATVEQKSDYLKKLKLSAHSVIISRNFLGQISPGQPTIRDEKGLPDFIKKTGISSWKGAFWDIYNGVLETQGDDIGSAFDQAVAIFTGKNPGKLAYIVPRNTKEFKVFISKTDELKKWSTDNKLFLNTYKEIGYLFAPNSGEYNPDVYAWMESEGLIAQPSFEDYLDSVQVAEDRQEYFAIEEDLNNKLKTPMSYINRKIAIDTAAKNKSALLISNPFLDAEIGGSGTGRGELNVMFKALGEAINSTNTPIDKKTRSLMSLAVAEIAGFKSLAEDKTAARFSDFAARKASEKERITGILGELSKVSPAVKEANRIIFTGLLNQYSRDTTSAGTGGK
jgi:hypothetical protein